MEMKGMIDNLARDMCILVHEALVDNNLREFGHSGYDGMADLCEYDHSIFLMYPNKSFIVELRSN